MKKTAKELEEENARLHAFILQVSQRLFLAAEVLSIKAEKKVKKTLPPCGMPSHHETCDCDGMGGDR